MLLFGWRGFHEILPTLKGLYRRRVSSHSNCPLCGFGEDTNAHAIFWCPSAQEVWKLTDYPFLVRNKEEISFSGVLLYATKFLEKESFARLLVYAWGIWTFNKRTQGQESRSPSQLKIGLFSYYEDFKEANDNADKGCHREELTVGDQVEVQIEDLVLYVDAAISTPTKMVGLGATIIGENNKVYASLSKPLKGTLSVLHAEALALLVGLCWAQDIGLPIKRFLSDSLSLVQGLDKTNNYHNKLGILLNDIKKLLLNFSGASISHVKRKHNTAAHNLAKQALLLDEESSWTEKIGQHA